MTDQKLEAGLAACYATAPAAIAALCDQHLDPTGALLGRVRALARPDIYGIGKQSPAEPQESSQVDPPGIESTSEPKTCPEPLELRERLEQIGRVGVALEETVGEIDNRDEDGLDLDALGDKLTVFARRLHACCRLDKEDSDDD